MTMTLKDMKAGERGVVGRISADSMLKKRFLEMGVVPGSPFEVVRVAPLGDPVEIRIKNYNMSLRRDEAAQIEIKEGVS